MNRYFFTATLTFFSLPLICFSQNVGIGTTNPLNKMQVMGNFVVTEPTSTPYSIPTAAQTKTMINGSLINYSTTDGVGRLFDPGGSAGSYLANLTANAKFGGPSNIGVQVVIEEIDLGTGDSLIFLNSDNTERYLAIGSTNSSTGTYIFNTYYLNIFFKSNADANIGTGFSLLLQHVYSGGGVDLKPGFAGKTLFFNTQTGAFRAGRMGDGSFGENSAALGYYTTASGRHSFATGNNTSASGNYSTAIGYYTTASGEASTAFGNQTKAIGINASAIGRQTTASGEDAVAIGAGSTASGEASIAIGRGVTASGFYSTAMGNNVSTFGKQGSFIIGDDGSGRGNQQYYNDVPNQMQMVFAGGYRLYTGNASSGVYMNGGDNSWSAVSDSTKKEKLLPVDGESFLNKISRLPLTTWNYKGQSPSQYRHYGPMAQDFYKAFGKDAIGNIGCDTLINQQDFLGINLIAIQALEKRTAKIEALQKQNTALQLQLEQVQQNNFTLQQQMQELLTTVASLDKQMKMFAAKEKEKNTVAIKE